jgi:hypothetical protein
MKKEEIELIIIKVTADGQEAINMKIYKNGTTCRSGVGGLPQLGISGMSFVNDSRFFDPLIEKIPQEVLDKPLNYEEETPNGYLEYVIAFYGVSKNGETGERAEWEKSTGMRTKVDHQTTFNHPIMGLLDNLTMEAAELTNEWYFDVIMSAKWGVKSSTMPETMIAQPKTEQEIHTDYDNYVNQMNFSARKWDMSEFVNGKTYDKDGVMHKATIKNRKNAFSINFSQIGNDTSKENQKSDNTKKKPWWKF